MLRLQAVISKAGKVHPFCLMEHQLFGALGCHSARMPLATDCATIRFSVDIMLENLMFSRFRLLISLALIALVAVSSAFAQQPSPTPADTKSEKKDEKKDEKKAEPVTLPNAKDPSKPVTAEQVAESSIFVYGGLGGRTTLNQIRKTAIERGKLSLTNTEGKTDEINYERWTIRADNLTNEKIRLDQEYPNARFALVFSGDKIFGIYNDAVFTPRDDASRAFQNQIVRGLEALLRYKENGSKIELAGREKIMGVDFYEVDVTDKDSRKTRFYISAKTFRVMMLDYEDNGVKYRRKFYNYNYAQGTLVPFQTVLYADGKIIENMEISTITFGQKIDEDLFKAG
jgi:hypothetical protein